MKGEGKVIHPVRFRNGNVSVRPYEGNISALTQQKSETVSPEDNPVLVTLTRSGQAAQGGGGGGGGESRHRGAIAVVDPHGRVVRAAGDPEQLVFPRSAIKPLQALALVESGAAAAFEVEARELALACASHAGTAAHTNTVARWLHRIGCGESDLVCGGHIPFDPATAQALAESGTPPGRLHDCCSGKHTGFLTLARHLNAEIAGYDAPTHPVQQRVIGVLEAMAGLDDLLAYPHGIDGCSLPAFSAPLGNLAMAMARMAHVEDLPQRRGEAATLLRRAVAAHPDMLAGPGQPDTAIQAHLGDRILVKSGAEGVYLAALPGLDLGVAIKIDDGAPRAAQAALGAVLEHLGVLDAAGAAALAPYLAPAVINRRGQAVGATVVTPGILN